MTTPFEIGPENSFNYPLPRIHGTSLTTPPPRNRAGKLLQLPLPRIHGTSLTTPRRKTPSTTPALEFTELHWLPPSKSGRKTPSTTPPLEFTELQRPPGRGSFSHTFLFRKQTLASATTAKDLGKLFFIPSYATGRGSWEVGKRISTHEIFRPFFLTFKKNFLSLF